jgi:hypothetical protein
MKKKLSRERSKKASSKLGELNGGGSGTAVGIESPCPEHADNSSVKEGRRCLERARIQGPLPFGQTLIYWTTIRPVMAAPCTRQSYVYVPGVLKVTA